MVARATPAQVLTDVAVVFGVSLNDLVSPSRVQPLSWARQAAMWVLPHRCPELSTLATAAWLGRRNHTTVIYGRRAAEARRQTNPHYAARLAQLLVDAELFAHAGQTGHTKGSTPSPAEACERPA